MKNEKVFVAWIEDNPKDKDDADILMERNKKLKIEYFHPRKFVEDKEKRDIDIFLVDFKLNQYKLDDKWYEGNGLYFSGFVKSKYPDIPIYYFSNESQAELFTKLVYITHKEADFVFDDYSVIQDKGHTIFYYDGLDYREIRSKLSEGLDKLIALLLPPDEEIEKIRGLLPHILKTKEFEGIEAKTLAGRTLDFAAWVRKILMSYPGFLYDSLYSATSLGMTEAAFNSKIDVFKPALYMGIFSKTHTKKLWWKTSLYDIVIRQSKEIKMPTTSDIKKLSTQHFKLKENEISKCAVCGEKYADTLGIELGSNEKKPVHLRCSSRNPDDTKMLFFDELRLIKS